LKIVLREINNIFLLLKKAVAMMEEKLSKQPPADDKLMIY